MMSHSPHSSFEHAKRDPTLRPFDSAPKQRHESAPVFNRSGNDKHCPVLIVEDDSDLREMMAQLLTLEGFQSATVANGKEALRYLSSGDTPNVILLDLMMPVMDGWEFRRVQQADPVLASVPTIVLSALDQARAADLKPAAFLKKPLDFDRLLQLVRDYCH
jgi:CheY-like chemotaxis protein